LQTERGWCNVIEYVSYCRLLWWRFCKSYRNFYRLISTWIVVSGLRDVTDGAWTRLETGKQCSLHSVIKWQRGTQRTNAQFFVGVHLFYWRMKILQDLKSNVWWKNAFLIWNFPPYKNLVFNTCNKIMLLTVRWLLTF